MEGIQDCELGGGAALFRLRLEGRTVGCVCAGDHPGIFYAMASARGGPSANRVVAW